MVLTREQFKAKPTEPKVRSFSSPPSEPAAVAERLPPLSRFLYVLAYPEPPKTGAANFEFMHSDIMTGMTYKIECVNGIVRTENKSVRDYLVNTGYLEMERKEIKNEDQN